MKVIANRTSYPLISRDSFLTPFDRLFDKVFESTFPELVESVGVKPFEGSAYPKVNVYEWDDKISVMAEIPGLDKKDLTIEVEDEVMTIKGNKHGLFSDQEAKVIRRELKHSAFERKFTLGESLDGGDISASFKDGLLNIEIPKLVPEEPKKKEIRIS